VPERAAWESERLVRKLRRRLWAERVFWLLLVVLLAAVHFGAIPAGRQVVLIAADGQPITVVATQAEARRLLNSIRSSSGLPADKVSFAQKVTFHKVPADRNPVQSDRDALEALSAKLTLVSRAAAIVANGEVVLALPDQQEAVMALSLMLEEFTPAGENTTVYFKEHVKVEMRDVAPDKLHPSAEKAVAKIAEASAPKGDYEVQPGDSAWKIAQKQGVSLSRLAAANPGVNLDRVRAGERLKIPGELPPLTVVARKEVEESVGEGPTARTRKIRITYENGAEVNREVIGPHIRPAGPLERRGRELRRRGDDVSP